MNGLVSSYANHLSEVIVETLVGMRRLLGPAGGGRVHDRKIQRMDEIWEGNKGEGG